MFRHRCSCSFLSSAAAHSGARSRLSQSCCQRFSIWSSPPSGVPVSPVRCRCQVLIFFGAVIQKSALQRALAPVLLRHSLLGFSSVLFSRAAVPGHFLRRGRWGVSGSCQLPPALRVLAGHDFPVVAFSFSLPLASGFDAGNFVRFLWLPSGVSSSSPSRFCLLLTPVWLIFGGNFCSCWLWIVEGLKSVFFWVTGLKD
jgi:hypothetical protein